MTTTQMVETLRNAAQRVREAWSRGSDTMESGRCALGALNYVNGEALVHCIGSDVSLLVPHYHSETVTAIAPAIERVLRLSSASDAVCAVWTWNDDANQTAENVATGLEYVALVLEQEDSEHASSFADDVRSRLVTA